ncbi:Methylmalonic aciduria type A-like protein, mitochondrial [Hypsibius exemplaris]|uniref:Methylmalonic aciduria type A-like protein, mitochondrial n=1 Tax=Hypsibius exemplaris TaxID=2072580 RepID=A0A1W0WQJ7_HYPEX|nr:Methylmalonic aciduria type A-like protein, mitochondrial [Hypsibius exemplaris]
MLKQIAQDFFCQKFPGFRFYGTLTANAQHERFARWLLGGLLRGDRTSLAEAITLIESSNPAKQLKAQKLLNLVLENENEKVAREGPKAFSFRIGISGPPGAGKSTFLEAIGMHLLGKGHKVGCLTVDPSSRITGGSLLGDKTRMPNLSKDHRAFIRPSPTCGILGGVTRTTSDSINLVEAAGFDVVFVETVGSGQNEYVVADMTDIFVVIISPGAGDELQAMKRGIMELSHVVIVNKSDGDLIPAARRTQGEYISALKFMTPENTHWKPKVIRVSSVTGEGIPECWDLFQKFRETAISSDEFVKRRSAQSTMRMWRFIEEHLQSSFKSNSTVQAMRRGIEEAVSSGRITSSAGALLLIDAFREDPCR